MHGKILFVVYLFISIKKGNIPIKEGKIVGGTVPDQNAVMKGFQIAARYRLSGIRRKGSGQGAGFRGRSELLLWRN